MENANPELLVITNQTIAEAGVAADATLIFALNVFSDSRIWIFKPCQIKAKLRKE